MSGSRIGAVAVLVALAAAPAGCSTTVTVTRRDGTAIEGTVAHGDARAITVQPASRWLPAPEAAAARGLSLDELLRQAERGTIAHHRPLVGYLMNDELYEIPAAPVTLAREDVADVDHPGNVLAAVGTFLGGSMTAVAFTFGGLLAAGAYDSGHRGELVYGVVSAGILALGLNAVAIWGWYQWAKSKHAVGPAAAPPPRVVSGGGLVLSRW